MDKPTADKINQIYTLIAKIDNHLTVMAKGLEHSQEYSCYSDVIDSVREFAWQAHTELETLEKQLPQTVILAPEELNFNLD